jgi:hypothetical protein
MSKYDRSTHRNDKAEKNRITDNRHTEDDEQAAYLGRWHSENPAGDIAGYCFVLCIAMIALCAALAWIKHSKPQPLTLSVGCRECHFDPSPVIRNLAEYKIKMRRPHKIKQVDLAELVRP